MAIQLYDYQEANVSALVDRICQNRSAVDGSDMGTGKTLVGVETAKRLQRPFGIICPKVSVPVWKRWCEELGASPLFVVNYEKLRFGNTGLGEWKGVGNRKCFDWNLPDPDTFLIWDEVHRAKGDNSLNARMLRDAKPFLNLLISATAAKDPTEMRALAHVLGLAHWREWWRWCQKNGCRKGRFGGLEPHPKKIKPALENLHQTLFTERGVRSRVAELDSFPETLITAEALEFDTEAIRAAYDEMEDALEKFFSDSSEHPENNPLTIRLRARQKTELLKIPGLVSLAEDALEDGHSVAIFVNFRDTLTQLCEKLSTDCAVYGGQAASWRKEAIEKFQSGASKIIILNIQAGGESISLHDEHGDRPRLALICPTDSAIALKQATGRVWRAGGKSKSIQKILFAADTVEEKICRNVQAKIKNIELLNDGDLDMSKELNHGIRHSMTNEEIDGNQNGKTPDNFVANHADRGHSKHSPSSLAVKEKCCGFQNDPNRDTSAADRGTLGHEAVEKGDLSLIPEEDTALRDAAFKCISWTEENDKGMEVHKELRLPVMEEIGHADRVAISPDGKKAHLSDYKFAHNFYKADSPQFWAYTIGVFDAFPEVDQVSVFVLHPFLDEIDTETFTRTEHYDLFCGRVRAIIEAAENPNPDNFRMGRHCEWCARAGRCPKLAKTALELVARHTGSFVSLPDGALDAPEIRDPAALSQLMKIRPLLEKAMEGWSKRAMALRLEEGVDIPGFELSERKGVRSITSARLAYEAIKDRVSAEDLLDAADLKITKVEGLWKDTFERGEKKDSLNELMDRLRDLDAVTSGEPTKYFRRLKEEEPEKPE